MARKKRGLTNWRQASALESSALRLRTVRDEDVTVPAEERDMKDSRQVLRRLGDKGGDTGSGGIRNTWLDVQDGEWAVTEAAERGGRCEVGKARPAAAGLEEDEGEEKREGLGIKMVEGAHGSLRSEGTSGRAEEGGGLGDGRVWRVSQEGRCAGREWGADRGPGKRWFLWVQ